jgi:hypothetical protein
MSEEKKINPIKWVKGLAEGKSGNYQLKNSI